MSFSGKLSGLLVTAGTQHRYLTDTHSTAHNNSLDLTTCVSSRLNMIKRECVVCRFFVRILCVCVWGELPVKRWARKHLLANSCLVVDSNTLCRREKQTHSLSEHAAAFRETRETALLSPNGRNAQVSVNYLQTLLVPLAKVNRAPSALRLSCSLKREHWRKCNRTRRYHLLLNSWPCEEQAIACVP